MAIKPSLLLDWISDDDAGKLYQPNAGEMLAGHISGTAADPLLFNWTWWHLTQWLEYLDGLDLTQITGDLDDIADGSTYGKVSNSDLTSNRVDFDKLQNTTVLLSELNEISASGAVNADYIKLHGITSSASEINQLASAGAIQADFIKLHAITSSAAELNRLDSSSGINITLANTTASGVYIVDTNGTYSGVRIVDSGGDAILIDHSDQSALKVISCDLIALDIDGYGSYGITIAGSGTGDALYIDDSNHNAIRVNDCDEDAFRVTYATDDAFHVVNCGGNAIQIENSTGTAIAVGGSGNQGLSIAGCTSDAIFIGTTSEDGIQFGSLGTTIAQHAMNVRSVNSSYDGLHCDFDGTTKGRYGSYYDNSTSHAININGSGDDGIHIVNCVGQAIEIVDAGGYGINILDATNAAIRILTAGTHGLFIEGAGSSGVFVDNAGHSAFYADEYTDAGITINYDGGSLYGHMRLIPGTVAPATDYASAPAGCLVTYDVNGDGSVIELWIQSGTTSGWVKVGGQ